MPVHDMKRTTFVLVHGAWHGGWCYRRVADRLQDRGYRVFTPTLSGMSERSHTFTPAINLDTHITDIVNLLTWEDLENVVLCGHSYGGMVVTGAADRAAERIGSLVYLDANIPEDGQSSLDIRGPEETVARMKAIGDGDGLGMPPRTAEAFNVNPADRAMVDAKCTRQPIGAFTQRIRLTGAHRNIAKKTFILAGDWKGSGFKGFHDKVVGQPGWTTHVVPCGHDVMLDMPDRLTELLVEAIP